MQVQYVSQYYRAIVWLVDNSKVILKRLDVSGLTTANSWYLWPSRRSGWVGKTGYMFPTARICLLAYVTPSLWRTKGQPSECAYLYLPSLSRPAFIIIPGINTPNVPTYCRKVQSYVSASKVPSLLPQHSYASQLFSKTRPTCRTTRERGKANHYLAVCSADLPLGNVHWHLRWCIIQRDGPCALPAHQTDPSILSEPTTLTMETKPLAG
jgi:hypothetical protein